MRLFEVAGSQFQDDLANVLKNMQGRANDTRTTSVVSWPALNNLMMAFDYGEINKDIMDKIQSQVDPAGDLIQDVTDQGVVLKTDVATPDQTQTPDSGTNSKSVDKMAHNAATKELQ